MPHPLLKGANIDAVLQMSRGVGVTKLVEKPTAAVGSFCTTVRLHASIFQLVRGYTMTAVQLGAIRNGFELFQHRTIGLTGSTRKNRIIRAGILWTKVS